MPSKLVPEVLFSSDGCCFDLFAISSDGVACFCYSYCVGSAVMAMVTPTSHCAMGSQSTIPFLNCYSRPY